MKLQLGILFLFFIVPCSICLAQDRSSGYSEFSPDGKLILTANYDSLKYRLFDAAGTFVSEINPGYVIPKDKPGAGGRIPLSEINPPVAEFSPNGKFVHMSFNYSIVIWDIAKQKIVFNAKDAMYGGTSPDGQQLFLRKGNSFLVYNTNTWKVSKSSKPKGYTYLSPDKKSYATGSQSPPFNEIKFVEIASGKISGKVRSDKGDNFVSGYSPDGKLFLTTFYSYNPDVLPSLIFWDVASGKLLDSISGSYATRFSPDGKTLLLVARGDDGQFLGSFVTAVDVNTRATLFKLEGHTLSLNAMGFSPDGKTIATSAEDGTVIVWDATNGKAIRTLSGNIVMEFLEFDPSGRYILTKGADQEITVWDVESGESKFTINGKAVEFR